MPSIKVAPVKNFEVPKPGSEQVIKLKFTADDNGKPFAFNQSSGSNIPSGYSPQGVIIDARNVTQDFVFQVGGITDFEITVHAGAYASYLIPAFDSSFFTVAGMAAGDFCIFYATNFPIVPQQYGLNVTVNLPIPTPSVSLAGNFIRVNSAGSVYEAQTPAQVLSDIFSGTKLTVALGGTGATTASGARANLGAAALTDTSQTISAKAINLPTIGSFYEKNSQTIAYLGNNTYLTAPFAGGAAYVIVSGTSFTFNSDGSTNFLPFGNNLAHIQSIGTASYNVWYQAPTKKASILVAGTSSTGSGIFLTIDLSNSSTGGGVSYTALVSSTQYGDRNVSILVPAGWFVRAYLQSGTSQLSGVTLDFYQ